MRISWILIIISFLWACLFWYGSDLLLFLLAFIFTVWGVGCLRSRYSMYSRWRLLFFVLIGLGLATFRIVGEASSFTTQFKDVSWGPVVFSGWVCREPDYRREFTYYTLCVTELNGSDVQGKARMKVPFYFTYVYGDVLSGEGVLEQPEAFDEFDYPLYLRRFGVAALLQIDGLDTVTVLAQKPGFMVFSLQALYAIKHWGLTRLADVFHEPAASLLAGLLIGYRGGFAEAALDDLSRTGLSHLIAVSGSNVVLIVVLLERMFAFLPKFWRLLLLFLGMFVFMIFTGLSAAVFRATVMGSLLLLGRYLGASFNTFYALLWSVFVICLVAPTALVVDVGLQLSVLAVVGILIFSEFWATMLKKLPILGRWFDRLPFITEALVLTLAAQMFVIPVLITQFGLFSIHAPLMNLLVAPLLPVLLLMGTIVFVFADVAMITQVFVPVIHLCAQLFLRLAQVAADVPFLVYEVSEPKREVIAFVFLVVSFYAAFAYERSTTRSSVAS